MNRQMQQLKHAELDLMRQFIQICSTLNLQYFVVGGTLLGAVRHQGFIPWDDDIDIAMLRKDYAIFVREAPNYLSSPYFLQTHETDPEYPANFAKLRNSNTTFIETSVRNCRINHGVYIDIFPLDYYPEKLISQAGFHFAKRILTGRIASVFHYREKQPLHSIVFRSICKLLIPSAKTAVKLREALYLSVSSGSRIISNSGIYGKKEIMPADWYSDTVILEFEGIEVTAPIGYVHWLTQTYGDYLQLPPESERYAHHYADVIDLTTSYLHYKNH